MKLMIGTVQLGLDYGIANKNGQPTEDESYEIIKLAMDNGIDWFDTAKTYGRSEDLLGKASKKFNTKLNIVTKTPTYMMAPDDIGVSLRESLDNLCVDSMYGVLVHKASYLMGKDRDIFFRHLSDAKDAGFVEKIGVTVYSPEQAFKIIENYDIDIVQLPCSILDQRFIKTGALEYINHNNVEVHARSIFLQGLLLMKVEEIPDYFKPIVRVLSRLNSLADDNGVSALKLSIDFIKSLHGIGKIIIGVQNKSQLNDIISAYNTEHNYNVEFDQYSVGNEKFIDPMKWDY